MRYFLILSLSLLLINCASKSTQVGPDIVESIPDSEYVPVVKRYTEKQKKYSGFHNTFQAKMTWLNSEVQTLALRRRGHFLQWDREKARTEREKLFQEMSSTSKVFLAFFSPENEYDDLHKPQTIWKIYLQHNGVRYEGKVRKSTEKYVELKEIYPQFDRFSTPYYVEFDLPMSTAENAQVKVVLTSSLGTGEFSFPARQ